MPRSRSKQYRAWTSIVVFIIVAGSLGSWLGATAVARSADQKSHKAFVTTSNEIAANLKLSIQREQDLINSTESFLLGNADTTQAQFTSWANDVHVLSNYPELLGLGVIKIVTASQLNAYARSASLTQSAPFKIVPAGRRSFYCLAPFGFFRTKKVILPKDIDLCATNLRGVLLKSRDTGASNVLPFSEFGLHTMGLETPLYRGATLPTTVAARRSSFAELVGLILKPGILLQRARVGHMNMAVAFQYGGKNSKEIFRSGVPDAHSQTSTINLHDGWTLATFDAVQSGGLIGDGEALALLLAGLALNLLLGALIFALGTGRARSMMLVEERTNELLHQAMHDALTGLPNRALIVDRIEQLLERNRRNGTFGAALYIDLDDFKNVNDTLGHEAGDRLLVAVAERMKNTLRGADTIGRMGGDEFVVLIDGSGEAASPQLVAERLLNVMRQPFTICGSDAPLVVTTSIGIALGDRPSGVEFLRDADVALYQAKAAGKNQYMFFDAKMQSDVNRRLILEFDLRSALVGEQFFLLFQPIYNLEDLTIVGVEALLRWRHPLQGVIQPDEFIPILERNGQIREVGAWVLREACLQMAAWHDRGHAINVSVNVSARQLDSDLIIDHIREAIRVSGLDVASLVIEVTETALMLDVEMSVTRLQAIKDLGVSIAIDDFGTGYCSLSYLRQFPIDCIKIDKSFTSAITTSPESQALVKTFIQLGKDLGLKTLAEGVETIGQMDLLRSSNVVEVQGFLFSHPLEPDLLESQILEPMRFSGLNKPPKSK
ncbi:MAG: EAL domain-containing protein [Acidimicrobiales bacterium]